MIFLDVAPLWVPYAFIAGGFLAVGAIAAGIVFGAVKLIEFAVRKNKNKEEKKCSFLILPLLRYILFSEEVFF